eukprot:jgi/Ulvmu1/6707/UM030_0040.1
MAVNRHLSCSEFIHLGSPTFTWTGPGTRLQYGYTCNHVAVESTLQHKVSHICRLAAYVLAIPAAVMLCYSLLRRAARCSTGWRPHDAPSAAPEAAQGTSWGKHIEEVLMRRWPRCVLALVLVAVPAAVYMQSAAAWADVRARQQAVVHPCYLEYQRCVRECHFSMPDVEWPFESALENYPYGFNWIGTEYDRPKPHNPDPDPWESTQPPQLPRRETCECAADMHECFHQPHEWLAAYKGALKRHERLQTVLGAVAVPCAVTAGLLLLGVPLLLCAGRMLSYCGWQQWPTRVNCAECYGEWLQVVQRTVARLQRWSRQQWEEGAWLLMGGVLPAAVLMMLVLCAVVMQIVSACHDHPMARCTLAIFWRPSELECREIRRLSQHQVNQARYYTGVACMALLPYVGLALWRLSPYTKRLRRASAYIIDQHAQRSQHTQRAQHAQYSTYDGDPASPHCPAQDSGASDVDGPADVAESPPGAHLDTGGPRPHAAYPACAAWVSSAVGRAGRACKQLLRTVRPQLRRSVYAWLPLAVPVTMFAACIVLQLVTRIQEYAVIRPCYQTYQGTVHCATHAGRLRQEYQEPRSALPALPTGTQHDSHVAAAVRARVRPLYCQPQPPEPVYDVNV